MIAGTGSQELTSWTASTKQRKNCKRHEVFSFKSLSSNNVVAHKHLFGSATSREHMFHDTHWWRRSSSISPLLLIRPRFLEWVLAKGTNTKFQILLWPVAQYATWYFSLVHGHIWCMLTTVALLNSQEYHFYNVCKDCKLCEWWPLGVWSYRPEWILHCLWSFRWILFHILVIIRTTHPLLSCIIYSSKSFGSGSKEIQGKWLSVCLLS